MSPTFELLTVALPTSLAGYNLDSISAAFRSTRSLHSHRIPADEPSRPMAQHQSRSTSTKQTEDNSELWFSLPNHRHHQQEQSAYQITSNRLSVQSSSSHTSVPTISTTPDLNKPLPPVSSKQEKKTQKTSTLRSFLRGRSANQLDPSHLQPGPYMHHHRHASADSSLSLDTSGARQQQFSRSVPNSPAWNQTQAAHRPTSEIVDISSYYPPCSTYTQASINFDTQTPPETLEIPPTRVRSFPEPMTLSPTTRQSLPSRPRPHTWLSPTEPFADASQFHLFVEATTGLSNEADPWSPNGPNRLQGSLFARRTSVSTHAAHAQNQYTPAPIPDHTHQTASWQSFAPPVSTSSRSVSAPSYSRAYTEPPHHQQGYSQRHITPHIHAINAELEMLGLNGGDGDVPDDEELPDYAQSQAEMNARKRAEAAARASELEARWRGARRARGRR